MHDDLAIAAGADQRAEPEQRLDFGGAAGQEMPPAVAQQQGLDARRQRQQPRQANQRRNFQPRPAKSSTRRFSKGSAATSSSRGAVAEARWRRSIAALVAGCQWTNCGCRPRFFGQ
jgi:hypothetical protein